MQSKAIIEFLSRLDSVEKLNKYWDWNPTDVVLRASDLSLPDRKILVSLISLYKKNKEKLPEYVKLRPALNDKSAEQSSSERLAAHKAGLFEGNRCINVCGGLGIDDLAFARRFKEVISYENDPEIHKMALFNLQRMGVDNIERREGEAVDFSKVELIYADPDRRAGVGRSRSLSGLSPDILSLKAGWIQNADLVLIKLSPMTDLTEIKKGLPETSEIRVVSLENEVKEVLVVLSGEKKGLNTYCDIVTRNQTYTFGFELSAIHKETKEEVFVEPALALIKANLDAFVMNNYGLQRVSEESSFYRGKEFGTPIPGRAFTVVFEMEYHSRSFSQYLKERKITQGHFKKRGFPIKVDELRKKHKLREGGEDYFFFYKLDSGEKRVLHGRKPEFSYSLF